MKQSKPARNTFLALLAVLMLCAGGCSKEDGHASGLDANPAVSDKTETTETEVPEEDPPTTPDSQLGQSQMLDFSRLDGMGNNLSNLSAGNDSFTNSGQFVSDDTYIYFISKKLTRGLWRMKLDGSECELCIPDLPYNVANFNLADEELYYSIGTAIAAVNLNTKEIRYVVNDAGGTIQQMLVVGDRVYWTMTGGALMVTDRDGSNRPYYCKRGSQSAGGGVNELATDGEKLYFFVSDGTGNSACLNVYEIDLNVPFMDAEEELAQRSSTAVYGNVFVPVNANFFAFGTNGFLMAKEYREEDAWKYEARFYDDIDGDLRTGTLTILGNYNEEKEDGSFYWRDLGAPKFVLGNTLFGVYNSKYEEAYMANTVAAPHDVYMMPDMDVSSPSLVYTYSGGDFVVGGVCGDKLCLIEKSGGTMKLTKIDQNGTIT